MFMRLVVALIAGTILGVERELVGQKAGVRTEMIVSAGAAMFTMVGLSLPYLIAESSGIPVSAVTVTGGLGVIAGVVTGIGFLGAGLIIKMNDQPHGVTTAALVWMTAAIGILAGIGMIQFAFTSTILIAFALYALRKLNVSEHLEKHATKNP